MRALAILLLAGLAGAQDLHASNCWGKPQAGELRWLVYPTDPHMQALYRGTEQIGLWSQDEDKFWWYCAATKTFTGPVPCPWERDEKSPPPKAQPERLKAPMPPAQHVSEGEPEADTTRVNYGIDWRKLLVRRKPRCSHNGQEITETDAKELLTGKPTPELPDDSRKPRLTLIGTAADRQAAADAIAKSPVLEAVRQGCLFQEYEPTDWAVARCGFTVTGHPTLYLQDHTGKVLLHWDQWPGAETLAEEYETIRRASPDYRPERDQRTAHKQWYETIPPIGWMLVAGAILAIALARRQNP